MGIRVTFVFDLAGRMTQRDYRVKVNSPSGTIADSDMFTVDKSSRMLTAVRSRIVNTQADVSFVLGIYGAPSVSYPSVGIASTKSFIHSWAGVRMGNIRIVGGRVVNVGNETGEPCAQHPGGAYSVLLDGSIRHLARDIDPQIAFALASVRGRDVVPGL